MTTALLARPARLPSPTTDPGGRRPANVRASARAELRRLIVWSVLLGVIGIGLLLGYVWVRLMCVEAGYRLSVTRQLVEGLEREGRELAVRAAAADSTAHLEQLAGERLGMRPAGRGEEDVLP